MQREAEPPKDRAQVVSSDASGMVGAVGLGDKASADTVENERVYNDWAPKYSNTVRSWGYDAPEQATSMLLAALDEGTIQRRGLHVIDVGRDSKRAPTPCVAGPEWYSRHLLLPPPRVYCTVAFFFW